MTDEEILKAFECCCGDDVNGTHCKDCPAEKYNFDWCSDEVSRKMVAYTKRLQAESAALRERFVALNKMPCNIGDTVYVLFGSCYRCKDDEGDHCSCEKRGKDKIFEMKVGSVRFDKDDYSLYEDSAGITSGLSCSGRNYGKTWFLSMEEAKNHLMKSCDV